MAQLYPTGTKIRLTMEVTVKNAGWDSKGLRSDSYLMVEDSVGWHHALYNSGVRDGSVKAEILSKPDDKYWPPQEDDVWRSDGIGKSYHYVGGQFRSNGISLIRSKDRETLRNELSDLKLVYRKL